MEKHCIITNGTMERVWDALVNKFTNTRFTTKQAKEIIERELFVKPKTAQDYFQILKTHWLTEGNSDLIQFRPGLFGWE